MFFFQYEPIGKTLFFFLFQYSTKNRKKVLKKNSFVLNWKQSFLIKVARAKVQFWYYTIFDIQVLKFDIYIKSARLWFLFTFSVSGILEKKLFCSYFLIIHLCCPLDWETFWKFIKFLHPLKYSSLKGKLKYSNPTTAIIET